MNVSLKRGKLHKLSPELLGELLALRVDGASCATLATWAGTSVHNIQQLCKRRSVRPLKPIIPTHQHEQRLATVGIPVPKHLAPPPPAVYTCLKCGKTKVASHFAVYGSRLPWCRECMAREEHQTVARHRRIERGITSNTPWTRLAKAHSAVHLGQYLRTSDRYARQTGGEIGEFIDWRTT